jgi:hypothetical protein
MVDRNRCRVERRSTTERPPESIEASMRWVSVGSMWHWGKWDASEKIKHCQRLTDSSELSRLGLVWYWRFKGISRDNPHKDWVKLKPLPWSNALKISSILIPDPHSSKISFGRQGLVYKFITAMASSKEGKSKCIIKDSIFEAAHEQKSQNQHWCITSLNHIIHVLTALRAKNIIEHITARYNLELISKMQSDYMIWAPCNQFF